MSWSCENCSCTSICYFNHPNLLLTITQLPSHQGEKLHVTICNLLLLQFWILFIASWFRVSLSEGWDCHILKKSQSNALLPFSKCAIPTNYWGNRRKRGKDIKDIKDSWLGFEMVMNIKELKVFLLQNKLLMFCTCYSELISK